MNYAKMTQLNAADPIDTTFGGRLPRADELPSEAKMKRISRDVRELDGKMLTNIPENYWVPAVCGKQDCLQELARQSLWQAYFLLREDSIQPAVKTVANGAAKVEVKEVYVHDSISTVDMRDLRDDFYRDLAKRRNA